MAFAAKSPELGPPLRHAAINTMREDGLRYVRHLCALDDAGRPDRARPAFKYPLERQAL